MKITAQLSRDDRFWLVYVPEIEQYTQGRSIKEAREMAVDLTATWLDVPVESVELVGVSIALPTEVQESLDRAEELRGVASTANHEAAAAVRQAATALKRRGLTVRDVGESLGVSYQRAHQLVSDR